MGIHSSKLMQLIGILQPAEIRSLGDFLASPYHNTDPRLRALLGYLIEPHPESEASPFSYESLSRLLFPGEPVRPQAVKDQMSRLTAKINQFLHIERILPDTQSQDLAVMSTLAERGHSRLFSQYQTSLMKKVPGAQHAGTAALQTRIKAARISDQLQANEKSRQYAEALQERADLRNLAFLIHKLQEFCDMLNRNNIYGQVYQPALMQEVLHIVESNPDFLAQATLNVWYHTLQTLLYPDQEEALSRLLQTLEANGPAIPPEDHRAAYKYALNFCIRQINAGKSGFLRVSFTVYHNMLQAGLLHVDGQLSHTDVKNIATAGIRLGEYAWVEKFLGESRDQVQKPFADNVYLYCLAYLYAESGQKREAMRLLQEVRFTDAYYALSARNLLLRIFLEQEEYEALSYQITAYEVFLRRNTAISPRNRKLHLNFARYLKKVLRYHEALPILKESERQQRKAKLLQRLQSQEEIPNREWLIRQLL